MAGTNFDKSLAANSIALIPSANVKVESITTSLDGTTIIGGFTAPPNYSLQEVVLSAKSISVDFPVSPPQTTANGAASPAISSVALFPQSQATDQQSKGSQDYLVVIKGVNLDKLSNLKQGAIAPIPSTNVTGGTGLSLTPDRTGIIGQFTAPTNYSMEGLTLSANSSLISYTDTTPSCDFQNKVKMSAQTVPKSQAGDKYGNGVAKNFHAIQLSLVNECPMAVIIPLAGIRVVIDGQQNAATGPTMGAQTGSANVLVAIAGDGQVGSVTNPLAIPLTISAYSNGSPAPGVKVTFADGDPKGTFDPADTITDSTGTASTKYTLPAAAGIVTITATSTGYTSATFTETAAAKTPTAAETANEGCMGNSRNLVPFSLDHVTSIYSTDRKLTGRRIIYFNAIQALATLGSAAEVFMPQAHGFAKAVGVLGGGFTTASKDVLVDMSAEQLQNLTSQSFGATEQVAAHGSLQKFVFVFRSEKCKGGEIEKSLSTGHYAVNWELSPASSVPPSTLKTQAQGTTANPTAPASSAATGTKKKP